MEIARLIADRPAEDVIRCDVATPVRDAVGLLAGKRIGALPVFDGETVAGIFSERDVIYRIAREGEPCLDRRVGEVMTSPAITVEPGEDTEDALGLMSRRRIRHLPVCDAGTLVGFISIGDLVKARIGEVENEAEAMRTYIRQA